MEGTCMPYNNMSQFAYKYKMVTPNIVKLSLSASEFMFVLICFVI